MARRSYRHGTTTSTPLKIKHYFILTALAQLSEEGIYKRPLSELKARLQDVSLRHLRRHLNTLEKAGVITSRRTPKTGRRGARSKEYKLNLDFDLATKCYTNSIHTIFKETEEITYLPTKEKSYVYRFVGKYPGNEGDYRGSALKAFGLNSPPLTGGAASSEKSPSAAVLFFREKPALSNTEKDESKEKNPTITSQPEPEASPTIDETPQKPTLTLVKQSLPVNRNLDDSSAPSSMDDFLGLSSQVIASPRVDASEVWRGCVTRGKVPGAPWDLLEAPPIPSPALLDEEMGISGRLDRLVRAYREVLRVKLDKKTSVLKTTGSAAKSKKYGDLLRKADEILRELKFPPIGWVSFALDRWVIYKAAGRLNWAKPPPLKWVYDPTVLANHRHQYRRACKTYEGGKVFLAAAYRDLLERYQVMMGALSRSGIETEGDVLAHFQKHFPGSLWKDLLHDSKYQIDLKRADWRKALAVGDWIEGWTI